MKSSLESKEKVIKHLEKELKEKFQKIEDFEAKLDLMKQENLQLNSKNVDSVKNITDIQTEYQNLLYITQVLIL